MKKILLLGSLCLTTATAFCVPPQPQELPDYQTYAVSPNGRYVASSLNGIVILIDTETDQRTEFIPEDDINTYDIGNGTAISDTGVLVGGYFGSDAAYYKGDEWQLLDVPDPTMYNLATSITPDGLRICGGVALSDITLEDTEVPMMVPAYWDLLPDGSYSEAKILPYPELDFSGRVPQYVTAFNISEDGKFIAGQVQDYSGMMTSLVVFTQDDEGNWSYAQPHMNEMLNPDGIVLPEYPGEYPVAPQAEDYMTDEEKAAYDAAYADWQQNHSDDYTLLPDPADYLSEEHKALYDEAMAEYEAKAAEWQVKSDAYFAEFEKIQESAKPLVFNGLTMTLDGKTVVSSYIKTVEDPNSFFGWAEKYAPVIFDIENDNMKCFGIDADTQAVSISADKTIFGAKTDAATNIKEALVFLPDTETPITLAEYFDSNNPEVAAWIRENMYHDVEAMDMETYEPVTIENVACTGVPYTTPTRNLIITHTENVWDYSTTCTSYLLPDNSKSGVKNVSAGIDNSFGVRVLKGGIVELEGKVDNLTIVDGSGKIVLDGAPTSDRVRTGINSGVVIVKATSGNTTKVIKAMI